MSNFQDEIKRIATGIKQRKELLKNDGVNISDDGAVMVMVLEQLGSASDVALPKLSAIQGELTTLREAIKLLKT